MCTECVNSSVARFARKFLSKFPRPVGSTTASCCAAKQEENCERNLHKYFQANLATDLLTHSVHDMKKAKPWTIKRI